MSFQVFDKADVPARAVACLGLDGLARLIAFERITPRPFQEEKTFEPDAPAILLIVGPGLIVATVIISFDEFDDEFDYREDGSERFTIAKRNESFEDTHFFGLLIRLIKGWHFL